MENSQLQTQSDFQSASQALEILVCSEMRWGKKGANALNKVFRPGKQDVPFSDIIVYVWW